MSLELGNFKYDGDRFFINDKYLKLTPLRYKLLTLLCENYKLKPVPPNKIIEAMYYDVDYRKEEPNSKSFRVIIYILKKLLKRHTGNKLTIKANHGLGYSLVYEENPDVSPIVKLTKKDIRDILIKHEKGQRATSIAEEYNINKHRVYDILIRSKQDKLLKVIMP